MSRYSWAGLSRRSKENLREETVCSLFLAIKYLLKKENYYIFFLPLFRKELWLSRNVFARLLLCFFWERIRVLREFILPQKTREVFFAFLFWCFFFFSFAMSFLSFCTSQRSAIIIRGIMTPLIPSLSEQE